MNPIRNTKTSILLVVLALSTSQGFAGEVPREVQTAAFELAVADFAKRDVVPPIIALSIDRGVLSLATNTDMMTRYPDHWVLVGKCTRADREGCVGLAIEVRSVSETEIILRPWSHHASSSNWCEYRFVANETGWTSEKGKVCGGVIACGGSD